MSALAELRYDPARGSVKETSAEALRLVCRACGEAGHKLRVLGAVYTTGQGLLLKADHLRRPVIQLDRGQHGGIRRTEVIRAFDDIPGDHPRENFSMFHFLGDHLNDAARWSATCRDHGERPLPAQQDLADAARDTRMDRLSL